MLSCSGSLIKFLVLWGTAGKNSNDPGACFEESTLYIYICSSVFGKERFLIPGAVVGVVSL